MLADKHESRLCGRSCFSEPADFGEELEDFLPDWLHGVVNCQENELEAVLAARFSVVLLVLNVSAQVSVHLHDLHTEAFNDLLERVAEDCAVVRN